MARRGGNRRKPAPLARLGVPQLRRFHHMPLGEQPVDPSALLSRPRPICMALALPVRSTDYTLGADAPCSPGQSRFDVSMTISSAFHSAHSRHARRRRAADYF